MENKYNLEAEKDFLSIALNNPEFVEELSESLNEKYFFDPFHKKIITKIKDNIIKSIPIEVSTISNNQREQQVLTEIKLRNKSDKFSKTFFSILEECFLARSLSEISTTITNNLGKDSEDNKPSKVLNIIRATVEEISNTKITTLCSAKELIDPLLAELEENYQLAKEGIEPSKRGAISTPFSGLNSVLKKRGFSGGNVIVVAASPSIGKTEFALNCAAHAAISEKKNVFVYSLEMLKHSLLERILLYDCKVPSDVLESGKRSEAQWQKVLKSSERIRNSNFLFEDNLSADIFDIITSIRKANNKCPLDLVVIDYLQLIQNSAGVGTRNDELSAISRAIKQESVRLNIPIIALSQLSRKHIIEGREPQLADLRDSGSIEQDADVVIMLYATQKEKSNKELTKTKAKVEKQREGSTGEFFLLNKKLIQTFEEIPEQRYKGSTEKEVDVDIPF